MPKLDQERVQKAIDRAYDAEVANLFKTTEVASGGAGSGGFTTASQCVGAFARSMKQVAFAYDKACEVAKQIATTEA